MVYVVQLVKMAALAAAIGLLVANWLSAASAALVAVTALWLLLARVS